MTKAIKTVVVKRSGWLRGQKDGNGTDACSFLCNEEGQQCCLGFLCRAVSIKDIDIVRITYPYLLPDELRALLPTMTDTQWREFTIVNDRSGITDKEREKQLKAVAKQHGFRFKFVP